MKTSSITQKAVEASNRVRTGQRHIGSTRTCQGENNSCGVPREMISISTFDPRQVDKYAPEAEEFETFNKKDHISYF